MSWFKEFLKEKFNEGYQKGLERQRIKKEKKDE